MTSVPIVALGEVANLLSGFAFDSASFSSEGGIPLVRIRDVVRGVSETFYNGPYDPRFLVRPGDLLIGMDGEFNCARWAGGVALLNQRVCKIEPADSRLDAGYLRHYLPQALKAIEDATPFVTVKHLSTSSIRSIAIPLPCLPEQRRIAEVLDRADELRDERRAAIAHLNTLTHAIFFDMFGDLATAAETDGSTRLGEVLTFVTSGSRGWAQYYAPSGSRFVRSLDVRMNRIASDSAVFVDPPSSAEALRTCVQPGDVLLTITGSRIGRVAAAPTDLAGAYVSQHVAILRLDQRHLDPEFAAYFLSTEAGQRQIAKAQYGQTKPGLNLDQIRSLRVPRPPVADQQEFKKRLTTVRSVTVLQEKALATLDALFSSLQHRAFRGEL